jgi:hypothetical protein
MSDFHLPTEIWKEVFKCLENKNDLKNCLLVCKAWYLVSRSFFSDAICIRLNDIYFSKLHADLTEYPALAEKVTAITLTYASSGDGDATLFRSLLNLCPNLCELSFDISDIYEYLKALNKREACLPSIQKIQIRNLCECSPAVRRFHLWVNHRFRATITSVEILDVEDNGALKDYGGLLAFATKFPRLTYLKAQCNTLIEKSLQVDLTALLATNKKLETLKLYGIGQLNNTLKDSALLPEAIEYNSLTKLKLSATKINIHTLEYIVTRFKNLKNIRLITPFIEPDNRLTESESTSILDSFQEFTKKSSRINISFRYKDYHYMENNGKLKPSWISNIMMLQGFDAIDILYGEEEDFEEDIYGQLLNGDLYDNGLYDDDFRFYDDDYII